MKTTSIPPVFRPVSLSILAASLAFSQLATADEVTLNPTWDLYNPDATSSLSSQSSTGFTATIFDVVDPAEGEPTSRPAITTLFDPVALSEVGDVITATFDLDVLDEVTENNDTDFRFAFFDTSTNFEIISGMIDLGTVSGSSMRIRIDDNVSFEPGEFDPDNVGDYSNFGGGGGTIGSSGGKPGGTGEIKAVGVVHRFVTTIERTAVDMIQIETAWGVDGQYLVATATLDETNPTNIDDVPPGGNFVDFDGFGFRLDDNDPFNAATASGRFRISNLKIESYKRQELKVDEFAVNPNETVTLDWVSQPDAYAGYDVVYSNDLVTPVETWAVDGNDLPPTGTLTTHTTTETFPGPKTFFSILAN